MRGLAILALCVPVQAQALSCMPHSVEAAFMEADEAEAEFVIVRGRRDFDARALPKTDWAGQMSTPEMTLIDAELIGKSLTASGFVLPYDKPVTLAVACYGPWCASAQQGSEVLAFVEQRAGERDLVSVNPCGGHLFGTPTQAMIKSVRQCFDGGACDPSR